MKLHMLFHCLNKRVVPVYYLELEPEISKPISDNIVVISPNNNSWKDNKYTGFDPHYRYKTRPRDFITYLVDLDRSGNSHVKLK